MGLTEKGFLRPTYNDILQDKISKAGEYFGEDIDTSDLSVIGKFLRLDAFDLAKAYEDLEAIYYARFPNTAEGINLDRLCTFAGIRRNPPVAASHSVTAEGTAGYVIPMGFLVSTDDGLEFYTVSQTVISEEKTANLIVACSETGLIGNVKDGAIKKIVNADSNISQITDSQLIEYGTEEESDTDLRKRLSMAAQGGGSCNANSIITNVLRVPGVKSVSVQVDMENHSFTTYVYTENQNNTGIAKAIFEKAPIGTKTTGNKQVTVEDIGGFKHTVSFSYTEPVLIYVKFTIETDDEFPADGKEQIKENIAAYINGLGVGSNVAITSIYPKIYAVSGVKDVTKLQVSVDDVNWNDENIIIADTDVANTTESNIRIEVKHNDKVQ